MALQNYLLRGDKVLNVPCWQLYLLESITLDSSSYSAVVCWIKTFVSQLDQFVTVLLAGKVLSLELEFYQPKSAEVSETVAL